MHTVPYTACPDSETQNPENDTIVNEKYDENFFKVRSIPNSFLNDDT